jgi:hypothetical protein
MTPSLYCNEYYVAILSTKLNYKEIMSPVVLYFLCHKNIEVKAALEKPVITNGKKVFLFPLIVDKCLDFVVCTLKVCKSCVNINVHEI